MSEKDNELDVQGHRVAQVDGPDVPEDTEGHGYVYQLEVEEDVEGHRDRAGDDEDVEGHVQPPRDTDLGNSPR